MGGEICPKMEFKSPLQLGTGEYFKSESIIYEGFCYLKSAFATIVNKLTTQLKTAIKCTQKRYEK